MSTLSRPVQVECYSGYTYAQEPRALTWQGQRYEITRVVKRWRTPSGPGFRVQVESPAVESPTFTQVDLTYLEVEDQWTMTVHNQPRRIKDDHWSSQGD